jgi:uncharacterized protein YwlG (UPF0340 family)
MADNAEEKVQERFTEPKSTTLEERVWQVINDTQDNDGGYALNNCDEVARAVIAEVRRWEEENGFVLLPVSALMFPEPPKEGE